MSTRRQAIVTAAVAFGGLTSGAGTTLALADDEISHLEEAIHEDLIFKANRKRVYEAPTDTAQFEKMTHESQTKEGGDSSAAHPTEISRDPGGTFTLFGGRIVGRHLELVPNERIVQAWRVAYWKPGIWSIVRFDLVEHGSDTKIVFEHAAFPKGDAANLVNGWRLHYWQPLEKFLSKAPAAEID
jgi:activator of HSP90 ATPase